MDHFGCDDHLRTSRSALLRRAAAAPMNVPIPTAVLDDGAGAFLAQGRSRREFLAGGVGALLAVSAAGSLGPRGVLEQAWAAASAAGDHPILVTLFLNGGNDGLNTLVPLTGPDRAVYEQRRRRIGIPAHQTLPVTGHPSLGWHPRAAGLRTLFDQGKLVAVPAVDYPQPDLSHFHSAHYWRTGVLDLKSDTGWLGRYLDVAGDRSNPLQGVAVEWGTDDLLAARHAPSCAVASPDEFGFYSPGVWQADGMIDMFETLGGRPRHAALGRAVEVARQTSSVRRALKPHAVSNPDQLPPTPLAYPDTDTGKRLRNLARMLGANLGIRVATVEAAGHYDTHDEQPEKHGDYLADLGSSLLAFQADLAARGLERRVLTLVWSEFGRRVDDNQSNGTDHGAGGLLLAVGGGVRGGVHADTWDLSDVDRWHGNVRVAVDFRDVYAGVLQGHLGVEAARVLPGYRGTPLVLTD